MSERINSCVPTHGPVRCMGAAASIVATVGGGALLGAGAVKNAIGGR